MRKLGLIMTVALLPAAPCVTRAEERAADPPALTQPASPVEPAAGGDSAATPDLHSGLKELALTGTLVIPNSSAKDSLGVLSGRIGYYVSGRSVVGVGTTLFVYSRVTDLYAAAYYRYLLRDGAARFQPYLGASAGTNLLSFYDWGGTQARFLATGDVGFRYFVSRRTGFEAALSLNYVRGAGDGFAHTTSTVVTFGLAHVF